MSEATDDKTAEIIEEITKTNQEIENNELEEEESHEEEFDTKELKTIINNPIEQEEKNQSICKNETSEKEEEIKEIENQDNKCEKSNTIEEEKEEKEIIEEKDKSIEEKIAQEQEKQLICDEKIDSQEVAKEEKYTIPEEKVEKEASLIETEENEENQIDIILEESNPNSIAPDVSVDPNEIESTTNDPIIGDFMPTVEIHNDIDLINDDDCISGDSDIAPVANILCTNIDNITNESLGNLAQLDVIDFENEKELEANRKKYEDYGSDENFSFEKQTEEEEKIMNIYPIKTNPDQLKCLGKDSYVVSKMIEIKSGYVKHSNSNSRSNSRPNSAGNSRNNSTLVSNSAINNSSIIINNTNPNVSPHNARDDINFCGKKRILSPKNKKEESSAVLGSLLEQEDEMPSIVESLDKKGKNSKNNSNIENSKNSSNRKDLTKPIKEPNLRALINNAAQKKNNESGMSTYNKNPVYDNNGQQKFSYSELMSTSIASKRGVYNRDATMSGSVSITSKKTRSISSTYNSLHIANNDKDLINYKTPSLGSNDTLGESSIKHSSSTIVSSKKTGKQQNIVNNTIHRSAIASYCRSFNQHNSTINDMCSDSGSQFMKIAQICSINNGVEKYKEEKEKEKECRVRNRPNSKVSSNSNINNNSLEHSHIDIFKQIMTPMTIDIPNQNLVEEKNLQVNIKEKNSNNNNTKQKKELNDHGRLKLSALNESGNEPSEKKEGGTKPNDSMIKKQSLRFVRSKPIKQSLCASSYMYQALSRRVFNQSPLLSNRYALLYVIQNFLCKDQVEILDKKVRSLTDISLLVLEGPKMIFSGLITRIPGTQRVFKKLYGFSGLLSGDVIISGEDFAGYVYLSKDGQLVPKICPWDAELLDETCVGVLMRDGFNMSTAVSIISSNAGPDSRI